MNMPNENEYFLIQDPDKQGPFDYIKVGFNWETTAKSEIAQMHITECNKSDKL